ncbi:glycosyltransferase [Candidatus Thiothrix anitrata]|uniref:Glycosyltransferase n=1 Tax=Candidatus Thiothrix anitrata TaxID=2823902 RepID=A0ABX7X1S8_9GAMM|nr:glycosyltransferase [Candidatus Thiothrix anitrata]QTR48733.1 glycosyltransferase [Candidatus Thiothrix anitrata]
MRLDMFTLTSSYGDAFSNVIGEAMACGIPCIATDVGDVPRLLAIPGTFCEMPALRH